MILAIAYALEGEKTAVFSGWAPEAGVGDILAALALTSEVTAKAVVAGYEPLAVTLYGWASNEKDPSRKNVALLRHLPVGSHGAPLDAVEKALDAALINMPKRGKPTACPDITVPKNFNPLAN